MLLGGGVEGGAVLGEQRLVGGDDGGAVLERGGDERAGRLDAADDLDDDVDVAAFDQGGGVGGEQRRVDVDALAAAAGRPDGDAGELDRGARCGRRGRRRASS